VPSARLCRPLHLASLPKPLLGFIDKSRYGFLGDRNPFSTCERRIGLVHHREYFESATLPLFPKGHRFFDGLLLASESTALDCLLNEGPLVRAQLDVHSRIVTRQT
jgi:hypothetical protein